MISISNPPVTLSVYDRRDSEDNNLLMDHAYKAVKPGVVCVRDVDLGAAENMKIYVGLTSDPPGGGDLIQMVESDPADTDTDKAVSAFVAGGEYFEVKCTNEPAYITWKNFGSLAKPVDYN